MLTRDTTVSSVATAARGHFLSIAANASPELIDRVSECVERLFSGDHPDYQKVDLQYHNLDHTVLATQCYIDLARGRVRHEKNDVFTAREFCLGYVAIMLHDSGYLKKRDDLTGTGAKYTTTHVERSCELAGLLLPAMGCSPQEITGVQNAIRCTGVNSRVDQIYFSSEVERLTGFMVATADYLGQMADPDYPAKLPQLFAEFEESNDFNQVPVEKRPFSSAKDLMAKTDGFWKKFALPKLDNEYGRVYRHLALPDGSNLYLESVERNLVSIEKMARQPD